jgi:hypothetical protein
VQVDEGSAEEIRACREEAVKIIGDRFIPNPLLRIIPDPPPDFMRSVTALRILLDERQAAIEKGDKVWADQLGSLLADQLGLSLAARTGPTD